MTIVQDVYTMHLIIFESKKWKQTKLLKHFQLVFSVEIKMYLSLFQLQLFVSKHMTKINSLNASDLAWPNDIEFDEKLKKQIQNLYAKVGASWRSSWQIYCTIPQLQSRSKRRKYE